MPYEDIEEFNKGFETFLEANNSVLNFLNSNRRLIDSARDSVVNVSLDDGGSHTVTRSKKKKKKMLNRFEKSDEGEEGETSPLKSKNVRSTFFRRSKQP